MAADDIKRVRRVATGLLLCLTLIFLCTFTVEAPGYWLLLLRAMAEAGMIGGLADWFAVEALFRHPLRIPIPHTALLPRNQKRAAKNIARFIDDHFLVPDRLSQEVQRLNPAQLLAEWLSKPGNAEAVSREIESFVHLILKQTTDRGLSRETSRAIRTFLKEIVQPADISGSITTLMKDTLNSTLMDDILLQVRQSLDENRHKVTKVIEDRSRWWIASAIDQRVVKLLVDGVLSVIDELLQRDSDLRRDFDKSLVHLVSDLHDQGRIEHFIIQSQNSYMESDAFAEAVDTVIQSLLTRLQESLETDSGQKTEFISKAIKDFSKNLKRDQALQSQINRRLVSMVHAVVSKTRPHIALYITKVIEDWDSDDLVMRMESEVGRDLQFIRINGAVLGAFVGGCLHAVTHSFA